MPRVSIVIPVYNVESYLALSIDSARRQTLRDIEIICVNDGSTDGSRDILGLAEAVDPRIVVVDKQNGGLSSARNAGIARASGDIICFLDSDDLLEENACQVLSEAFDRTNADVVTYGAVPYPEFGGYWWLNQVLSPRDVVYEGFRPALLFEESSHPFAWRTACTRDFFQDSGLLFDETLAFGEDQLFHFALYPRASRTALIADKLVKYRVSREGSLMFSSLDDPVKRIRLHLDIVERIFDDWKSAGFMEAYGEELFAWSIEFIVLELVSLDESGRKETAPLMDALWRRYFDKKFLESAKGNRRYGHLVRFVASQGMIPLDSRLARFRYYARTYGRADAAKRFARWLRDRTWGRVKNRFAKMDPDATADATSLDELWENEDLLVRERALGDLRDEAGRESSAR